MPSRASRKVKKQISIYMPIDQWRALRAAAVAQKMPLTKMAMSLMEEGVKQISEEFGSKDLNTGSSKSKPKCK